jgi:cytoskeleton protein RodZ
VEVGHQLSEARQRRNLTLADISRTTKIPVHLLDAIERNDESHLPQQFFRRAFVRAYAKEVGMNADALLDREDIADTTPVKVHTLRSNAVVEESGSPRSVFFVALAAACMIYYGYTLQQTPGSAPHSTAAAYAAENVSVNDRGDITLPAADTAPAEVITSPPAVTQSARHDPIDAAADSVPDSSLQATPAVHVVTTEQTASEPLSVEPSPVVSDAAPTGPDLVASPAPAEQF